MIAAVASRPLRRSVPATALAALLAFGSCQWSGAAPRAGYRGILDKPEYAHAHWGIHVEDLATGDVVLSTNGDRLFAPASNAKLFSVAAAFEEFGAKHRFETPVHRQGTLSADGTLDGELILRPTGDLTLGGRDDGHGGIAFGNSDHIYANGNPNTELTGPSPLAGLDALAAQIHQAGIKSVRDVVIDDRLFTRTSSTGSGPTSVTPIVVNDNLVDFIIRPTTVGGLARVDFRPRCASYVVESRIRTTGPGPYAVRIESPRSGHFVLTGAIPHRHPRQIEVQEVRDPAANARRMFIEALLRAGVVVRAPVTGPNPGHLLPRTCDRLPIAARLVSAPFAEEARLILKVSHNLHASTLPLLLAVRHGHKDLPQGMRIQGELLRRLGVDVDALSFGGAAGGDRADMVTPRATVQLLRAVAARPYYAAFRRALPILGVDGTLARVQTDSPARGKVQAKTGTYYVYDAMNQRRLLTSKALGGYMATASGRQLAFSIVVNNVHLDRGVSTTSIGSDLGAISAAIQQAH